MTIKKKLILLVLFLTALSGINGYLALHGMADGAMDMEEIYQERARPLRDLREIADAYAVSIVDANHKVRDGILTPGDGVRSLERATRLIAEKWGAFKARSLTDEEKALVEKIDGLMKPGDVATAKLNGLMAAGDLTAIGQFAATDLYSAMDPITEAFGHLIEHQLDEIKAVRAEHEVQTRNMNILIFILLIGGSGMALVAAIQLIERSVSRPLAAAGEAVTAMASGDLTRALPSVSTDEVGTIIARLGEMQTGLRSLISGVRGSIGSVSASATQLAAAASETARSSQEQSDSAATMAATVEQLSVSIDQVHDYAREAGNVTNESGARLDASGRVIAHAADGIRAIAETVNATASSIQELEAVSSQISSIVDVIRDIAEQTNLLALNAAIEAARAGEQGRGFAVVADEVRKLAERTTKSTSEIGSMIQKIQQGAQRAVGEMQEGVARVGKGVQLANQAGASLEDIRSGSAEVSSAVLGIGSAIQEQATATREIAQRVEHIAQGADRNSAASAQTAAAAGNLQQLARDLEMMAAHFAV